MSKSKWKCRVCGNVVQGLPPKGGKTYLYADAAFGYCVRCKSGGRSFEKVEDQAAP